jgi:inorganic pyrophosphatase
MCKAFATLREKGLSEGCMINERLKPGSIVECEPIGLLEQREGQEIDHKIVAALPGQHVVLSQTRLQELQDFIYAVFAEFPDEDVRVGPILPREAALKHIQTCREE